MPSPTLTAKQTDVVICIRNFSHIHGYPPTIREIAALLDRARGTVKKHLETLQKKGVIRTTPKRARAIEILNSCIIY